MSSLDATFTLTPGTPRYSDASGNAAYLYCIGADFTTSAPNDFVSLYGTNRLFFSTHYGADPTVDYSVWANRVKVPFLLCSINLASYVGRQKQLALIFGFDATISNQGHVLVYSDAGLLKDETLMFGDNQFLLEIESLDSPFSLYFIHAGGNWFFTGLSGYVV